MHEDKHQAPTHLRIRPLSLQNAGDASVPMGVITLFDWKNSLGARADDVGKGKKHTGYLYKALMVARRLPQSMQIPFAACTS